MENNDKKFMIWSHWNYLEDSYREDIKENYPDASEDKIADIAYEYNQMDLEDEICNIRNVFKNEVLMIGSIALWDGGRNAAKLETDPQKVFGYHGMESAEYYIGKGSTGNWELTGRYGDHDDPFCSSHVYIYSVNDISSEEKEDMDEIIFRYINQKESLENTIENLKSYIHSPVKEIADIYGWELQ